MFGKKVSNLVLYTVSFLLISYIKNSTLIIDKAFWSSYEVYIASWLASSIISRKFRKGNGDKLYNKVYSYFISFFLMLGIITLLIIKFHLSNLSHFVFISSIILSFVLELIILIIRNRGKLFYTNINFLFSKKVLTIEFILYAVLMLYISIFGLKINTLNEKYATLILSLYLSWFTGLFFGHLYYNNDTKNNYWNYVWFYLKSYIIIACLNIFISFILNVSHSNFTAIINSTGSYTALSFITVTSFYYTKRKKKKHVPAYEVKKVRQLQLLNAMPAGITFDDSYLYEYPEQEEATVSLRNQLKNVYLKKYPDVYDFLCDCINIYSFEVSTSVIQKSNDMASLEFLPEDSLEFFFNMRQMNDLRRINCYLIEINKKLKNHGIFISRFETINLRYKRFISSYPYYLARLFYFFDFIWERIFPKIPYLQKIYFALSKGNNRAISFAEGLGRLYYCGYEIINAKEIDDYIYFIAKKVRPPLNDLQPSYGPLFRMKRTGLNGNTIYVYKVRTMHPYAEYLQKFVYEKFSLQDGGKFKNDFRVTSWGRIFRKLWLDELPMIINFMRGELKLVGVRPLSNQYLNLYTNELKEKRMNYKPGLIPPFYADMPKTLYEIMDSEKKYLNSFDRSPILTDIRYFYKAFYNILIKRVRSK